MREATNEWSDLVNSSNVVRLDVEQFTVSLGDHHCLSDGERKRWRRREIGSPGGLQDNILSK
jgi:hypothetical protein